MKKREKVGKGKKADGKKGDEKVVYNIFFRKLKLIKISEFIIIYYKNPIFITFY